MRDEKEVLIVGGGIGGATLALALVKKGKRVLVLEKETDPVRAAGRPEVLSSATMAIFKRLGVDESALAQVAEPMAGLEFHHSERGLLLRIGEEDFQRNQVRPYFTDPAGTRRVLMEKACGFPEVEVRRGVEVTGLVRHNGRFGGVTANENGASREFLAPLVIGDDGGRSKVREQMGISLKTHELPAVFVVAFGPRLPELQNRVGQGWVNPTHLKSGIFAGVFVPVPGNRSAIVFFMRAETFERYKKDPDAFYTEAAALSPLAKSLEKTFPISQFKAIHRPFGHAPRYVADGAVIIGDAAHPVTPVGGQGANMTVSDAVALADVLAAALQERNFTAARLAEYETRRRAANSRSLRFSIRARYVLNTLAFFPWLENLLITYVRRINRDPRRKDRLLQAISRTFLSNEP